MKDLAWAVGNLARAVTLRALCAVFGHLPIPVAGRARCVRCHEWQK